MSLTKVKVLNRELFTILILILGITFNTFSQSELNSQIEKAKGLLDKGDYVEAEKAFKKIIKSNQEGLPDEISYFYGLALLKLNKNNQAKAFLERYLTLTGDKGEFYGQTKELMVLLQPKICSKCNGKNVVDSLITCQTCSGTGIIDNNCNSCLGKGIVRCAWCHGKGIVPIKNAFNVTNYQQCNRCAAKGTLVCIICQGDQRPKIGCKKCGGIGSLLSKVKCSH